MIKGYLISAAIGAAISASGILAFTKALKPVVNFTPTIETSCPECPQCPPSLGNELEKIKGRNVTVNLHQKLIMQSDSLFAQKLVEELDRKLAERLSQTRLARCK